MFSFFKKKTPALQPEVKIWLNWQAKYEGFVKEVQDILNKGNTLVIVTYFPKTGFEVEEILKNQQLTYAHIQTAQTTSESAPVILIQAEQIAPVVHPQQTPWATSPDYFLFPELSPIHSREKALLEQLYTLAPKAKSVAYADLESPLLKAFASDRMQSLLETLGLREDECIQHRLVTKSVVRVQKKVEEALVSEQQADSMQEWFAKNAPQTL